MYAIPFLDKTINSMAKITPKLELSSCNEIWAFYNEILSIYNLGFSFFVRIIKLPNWVVISVWQNVIHYKFCCKYWFVTEFGYFAAEFYKLQLIFFFFIGITKLLYQTELSSRIKNINTYIPGRSGNQDDFGEEIRAEDGGDDAGHGRQGMADEYTRSDLKFLQDGE